MAARTLLPYQSRWVADRSPLKACVKGRRIGLSWCEAYDCVMHAAEGAGSVYYQSYNREMTAGFIDDCAGWAQILQAGAEAAGESVLQDPDGDIPCFRLDLASGRQILAMTSAPRVFRSKGRPGDIGVIDEAAFVNDLDEVLKAALAFLVWGGRIRVISTHNGEGSPFNRLLRDIEDGVRRGSVHEIRFKDALGDGLYRRICEVTGAGWSAGAERSWEAELRRAYGASAAEELDCIPSAGGGAWLRWNLLRQARSDDAGRPELAGSGAKFIGIDIARKVHKWVAVVFELDGGVLWLREMRVEQDIPFSEQEAILAELTLRHRPVRIGIDQTGLGMQFTERAAEKYGPLRVVGVTFTAGQKLDMAIALRQRFEDGLIRISRDEGLQEDLYSVRRAPGTGDGPPRLAADESADGSHGDRFWACAIAAWLGADLAGPFDGEAAADAAAESRRRALDLWSDSEVTIDYGIGVAHGAASRIVGFV